MRYITLTVLLTATVAGLIANDGAYLSSGGVFYPMKETRISLAKEFLSFTVRDKKAQVDVLFEFMNPEASERTLMVGFQAPSAAGDVQDEVSSASQIRDFRVLHEGKLLPYAMKVADCEDCPLLDPSDRFFTQFDAGVFVYLFELTFKPGVNRVQHSYEFPASEDVATYERYSYILRTGSKWAGTSIGEFTLLVDMGPNRHFYVCDVFGKEAAWSILGTGKLSAEVFAHFRPDSAPYKMVRTLSGRLLVTARDLKPDSDIEFGAFSQRLFNGNVQEDKSAMNPKLRSALYDLTPRHGNHQFDSFSPDELRLLRNMIYALHGYSFADKKLLDYFSRFDWYIPDPNLRMEEIRLSPEEQRFVQEILSKEKG